MFQNAAAGAFKMQALVGVGQWVEHHPVNQKVTGLFTSQGMCLGCGPGRQ